MKLVKYILVSLILSSSVYSKCFVCGVLPSEMNIHMASNEYNEEIKKKKKKGKKLKGKAGKGKKGGWGKWKSKWKKNKKEN
tara:strand:+ start:1205 stop:1447 length:243 start_codon:yes stop_codon:yes gene_type:complete